MDLKITTTARFPSVALCVCEREKGAERWGERKREGEREELKLISYIGPASITQFPQYTAKTGTRIWKVSSYFIEPLPSVPYPNLRKNRENVHQDTPPPPCPYTPPPLHYSQEVQACVHQLLSLWLHNWLPLWLARPLVLINTAPAVPSQRLHWQDTICPISPQLSKTWHKLCRLLSTHRSSTIPLSCYLHPLHFHVVLRISEVLLHHIYLAETVSCTALVQSSILWLLNLSLVQRTFEILLFDIASDRNILLPSSCPKHFYFAHLRKSTWRYLKVAAVNVGLLYSPQSLSTNGAGVGQNNVLYSVR